METRSKVRAANNALKEGQTDYQDGSRERSTAFKKTEVPLLSVPLIGPDGTVLEPYVGMEFDSEEDARRYYNDYAMRTGFGSRVSRNRRSRRDGEIIARDFVCFKEGFRIKRHGDNGNKAKRHRINTREGCLAMISVKKTSNGKWVVSKFIRDHNHALLSPSEASCLRSHRNVTGAPKKMEIEPLSDKDRELIEKFEGAENLEPYEGMELESEEAARLYYTVYARRVGFRSRISKNRRSRKDGKIIARTFVCYKEGFRINRHGNKRDDSTYRPRAVTREGCEAMFTVKKTTHGRWVVSKFVKEHNHSLLDPSKVRWLRSHSNVSYTPRKSEGSDGKRMAMSEMKSWDGVGCNPRLAEIYGFNCNQASRKRKRMPGKDPQNVLDYLERMQSENPAFFYAVKIDDDENLRCIFWADARSRMAYNYFGDVVRFDTAFKMNKYEVPFAPFTGVNHHQQSTLFGCAVIYDESELTFVWLFNAWLEAMSGRHPITIITDHDATIEEAVTQVFPKTSHCYCKWQILQKAPKQLAQVSRANPAFLADFQKLVDYSESAGEFESSWKSLMDRYGIKKNEWLQSLYTARQKWAPVYLHDIFFAEIPTSQQSECLSPFFDGYVTAKTLIEEFIMQYERAVASRYEKELEEDIRTAHTKPNLKTRLPIEKQAANAYTRVVFLRVQEEIFESLGFVANKITEEGPVSTYAVSSFEDQMRAWTVTINILERKTSCSCLMFESCGILCRHALIVLTASNFMTLPSHYILERLTKNAKNVVGLDKRGIATQANCRKSPSLRHSFLCKQAIRCAEVGSTSVQDYDVAMRALREAWEKILVSKDKDAGLAQLETQMGQQDNNHLLHDPNNMNPMSLFGSQQPKKRGRPRKSGSKPDGDKATKSVRKCTLCKESGHDSSNCPRLRPIGNSYGTGSGMLVVDAGPSDLHGRGGIGADQLGFSEGILDLSLGDRFDSHGTSGIPNFAPSSFFQIASLANPRLLNANEEFTLTGGRPSFGP